jgi:hypothetical protein
VFQDLAVEFVDEQVDSGVKIFAGGFAMNVFAAQMHGDFGFLPQGLYREHDLGIDNVIEMSQHTRQFVHDIGPDGRGDVEMATANAQVHTCSPTEKEKKMGAQNAQNVRKAGSFWVVENCVAFIAPMNLV